jgi:RNA polymerase sigma-70 factor (ECF subfamily)
MTQQVPSVEAVVKEGMPDIYPRLWRYAVALTGRRDWADDLAQATCIRAIEKADLFQPGTQLDRWMFRMAQRLWYNELRSRKVRKGGGLVPVEETDLADPGPAAETNILAREVLSHVQGLPDAQRETVFLVYVEGYSYKEAAEMLEIPIGTVMSRLAGARKRLSHVMTSGAKEAAI